MFRDRVVSMEQTLEGGEKHLALLKELCREAFPDHELAEHALDHERDLFVMELRGPDGAAKKIAWTRMVLYDAERIPTLTGDPAAQLRGKIVEFLRARAGRTEIVVTFRHLEEGWVDTPEPRREGGGRRRRRGGRGGGRGERAGGPPDRRPATPSAPRAPGGDRRPQGPKPQGQRPQGQRPQGPRPGSPRPPAQAQAQTQSRPGGGPDPAAAGPEGAPGDGGKRRRRFRRRRRGGRGPGGGPAAGPGSGSGEGGGRP
jgi:hypothetical protein